MTATDSVTSPQGGTRQDRSRQTKQRLLDATIDSIIEVGYARTSMQELCTRAGISRGAQLHHFPTKEKLMAAAVVQLGEKQLAHAGKVADRQPPGVDRVDVVLDQLVRGFSGRLAQAILELWIAARTDPELRASVTSMEHDLTLRTEQFARDFLGDALDEAAFQSMFGVTLFVMRGVALDEILRPTSTQRDELLKSWRDVAKRGYLAASKGSLDAAE